MRVLSLVLLCGTLVHSQALRRINGGGRLGVGPSGHTWARVNHSSNHGNGAFTVPASTTLDCTGANFYWLAVVGYNSTSITVSDGTNTYHARGPAGPEAGGQEYIETFYAYNVTGGAVQWTINASYASAVARCYSGGATADPLDQENLVNSVTPTNTGTAYTLSLTSTTLTPAASQELWLAVASMYISPSGVPTSTDSPFTLTDSTQGASGAYEGIAVAEWISTDSSALTSAKKWNWASGIPPGYLATMVDSFKP